jgi:hypothetical protein
MAYGTHYTHHRNPLYRLDGSRRLGVALANWPSSKSSGRRSLCLDAPRYALDREEDRQAVYSMCVRKTGKASMLKIKNKK